MYRYILRRVRCLFLVVVLAAGYGAARGQYVTIPDTNFVNWLNNNGYASCMNGNQIDTLCADTILIHSDTLNISNQSISDFTGIRFLRFYAGNSPPAIDLSHNNLTNIQSEVSVKIGNLSEGTLILDYNHIDTLNLDSVGSYLGTISIQHNNLNQVISHLTDFYLSLLNLNDNNLDSLPNIWSPIAWSLFIRRNHFVKLPNLSSCSYIDVGVNLIDSISGPIPPGLSCDSNLLRHLDISNYYFAGQWAQGVNCSHNLLTTLTGLRGAYSLDCSYNQISRLDSLNHMLNLVANNNNLSSIGHFSTNLTMLDVSNNPLLQCIPNLPNVTNLELDYSNTAIACLPRQFPNCTYTGTPGINAVPTCNLFNNIYGCPQYSNTEGYGYFDTIPNCIMDTTEPRYPYIKTAFGANGNIEQQAYTDWRGHYSFDEISYGTYQITVDTTGLPFSLTCPDTFYYTTTVDSQELYQSGFNFGFRCKPGFDVGVNCIVQSSLWFHPNLITTVYLDAGDMSAFYGMHCAAGIAGQVSMTFSGPISYVGPAPGALVPSSVTNTTITWNISDYGSINPQSAFAVLFITDTNAQNFAPVCFFANVLPIAGDNNPANNNYSYCSEVILAWDPNGKEVYPTGQLDSTQNWLTYSIHFKNTGLAPATNIYILDTLSTNLDINTFRLLGFDHQNVTQILPGGVVKFSFPFINLSDSVSNDSASTGYIQYKVKLKNNLPGGTIITNSAFIYFDYNAPIATNSVADTVACFATYDTISTSICQGDSFAVGSNQYYDAGIYSDTLLNAGGCDSIVTLILGVYHPVFTFIIDSICPGGHVLFGDSLLTQSGVYADTVISTVTGCDSIVILTLTVKPLQYSTITDSICSNGIYNFNGTNLSASGTYTDTLTGTNGCDSIVTLNLVVRPVLTSSFADSVCNGGTYHFNGAALTAPGNYTDTLNSSLGCDSLVTLHLSLTPGFTAIVNAQICQDSSYTYNGITYIYSGTYNDTLYTAAGCDSIITLNLQILPQPLQPAVTVQSDTLTASLAPYYQWFLNGTPTGDTSAIIIATQGGNYQVLVTGPNGCSNYSAVYPMIGNGITQLSENADIKLYPNPNSGWFTLQFSDKLPRNVSISDVLGNTILPSEKITGQANFNLNAVASGVYFMRVELNGAVRVLRFVVSK